jgi:hypothetical protein
VSQRIGNNLEAFRQEINRSAKDGLRVTIKQERLLVPLFELLCCIVESIAGRRPKVASEAD